MPNATIIPRQNGTVIINGKKCPMSNPDPAMMDQIKAIIQKEIDENHGGYPEDIWVEFGINGRFDLNIWTDCMTGEQKASIYRVKNNQTDTSEWEIIPSEYIPKGT